MKDISVNERHYINRKSDFVNLRYPNLCLFVLDFAMHMYIQKLSSDVTLATLPACNVGKVSWLPLATFV